MSTDPASAAAARPFAGTRAVTTGLTAVLLLLASSAPVLAHAELESSVPADKSVLQAPPTTITLTFTEHLDAKKSSFKLVGPDGAVGTGKVADQPAGMTLDGLTLTSGDYEIRWTAVANDGHVERGIVTFTVAEPTAPPPTPRPTASASASAAPTPVPTIVQSVAPTPSPSEPAAEPVAASTGDVLLPIVAGLVVVAIVGGYVVRRSRRA